MYFHPLQPFSDCYLRGRVVPFEVFEDERWLKTSGARRWRIGQKGKSGYRSHGNDTYDSLDQAEQACASAPKESYLALVQVDRNDQGIPVVTIRRQEYERFLFDLRPSVPKSFDLTADDKKLLVHGVEVYRFRAIQATQEVAIDDLIGEVRQLASTLGRFPTVIDFRLHSAFDHKTVMKRLKVTRWSEVKRKLDAAQVFVSD